MNINTIHPVQPKIQWMQPPPLVTGCPPGLEYLAQLDQILIHQQVELLEVFTGIETPNRYAIKNSMGQQCYFAHEESDDCMRICCGPHRGFLLHIVDNMNQEVFKMNKAFKFCAGCCWCAVGGNCCAHDIDIETPTGEKLGSVRQVQSFWKPYYDILDEHGKTVLKIKGPCCCCQMICCTEDIPFEVISTNDQSIGSINKQWGGIAKEMMTKATNFAIRFPVDLDVKMKACLIGAAILINMMFYEDNNNNNN